MRALVGMKWGLAIAAGYSAFLLVLLALGGARDLKKMDLSVGWAIALYFIAGALGGLAFGALWVPNGGRIRKVLVAWLVTFIVLSVLSSGVDGAFIGWSPFRWFVMSLTALFMGGMIVLGTATGSRQK